MSAFLDETGTLITVSSSNPLPVISTSATPTLSTNTATVGAANAFVSIAVTSTYKTASMYMTDGNLSGTLTMQYSVDGGATWYALLGKRLDHMNGGFTDFFPTGANTVGLVFEYPIPINCTNLRAICVSYNSGSSTVKISLSSVEKQSQVLMSLSATANRIGLIAASGVQYTDTTSALGSSATFTSTARDLTASSSAAAFASASTNAKSLSICVVQDVAFTLQLLGSTDNFGSVSEIYRSITATLVGSNYVAEVDNHSPAWRYFQYKIINGASAATKTRGISKFLAN